MFYVDTGMFCDDAHTIVNVNGYTLSGNTFIFIYASRLNRGRFLTPLHSGRPKLYTILVFLSAIGLNERICSLGLGSK